MKYKNTPKKRRILYRKTESNQYELKNIKNNIEKRLKFSNNILNYIQTLYDSDYVQITPSAISGMYDYLSDFDNDDYDWLTYEEYNNK